jgi:hypothetical protein
MDVPAHRQHEILAQNRDKGMFAFRADDGTYCVMIVFGDAEVGDVLHGDFGAPGTVDLQNATKRIRVRAIMSIQGVPGSRLWHHLFFDSEADFIAANPHRASMG